jgi:hypothetical protein
MAPRSYLVFLFGLGMLWSAPLPALAVIERPLPLKSVIADADHIAFGSITAIDASGAFVMVNLADHLKGKLAEGDMKLMLRGSAEGKPADFLDRVKVGQAVMLFVTELGDRHQALAYTEGSWFQVIGELPERSWHLTHGEPYLRRTYKETTASLKQVVADAIAGKTEPPGYNKDEAPGLGPVVNAAAGAVVAPPAPAAAPTSLQESLSPWVWVGVGVGLLVLVAVVAVARRG